jgi:ribulose-5-phosphate 4-epimerase/fuculose-1-phosphate aldolase
MRTPASIDRILFAAAVVAAASFLTARIVAGQNSRPAAPTEAQLTDDLVAGNRILANEGVLDGLGHISVRSPQRPDRFVLSRDLAPALVTAADLMEYDLEGAPVNAQGRTMYQERFIHSAIYKARPDVHSIVHSHVPSVLPFTDSSVALRPMYHMSAFLLEGVPMYEIRNVEGSAGMLVNNARLGAALAVTLADKSVALMRGHGVVIVGPTIPEAVSRSIFLDVNARVQAQAIALGGTIRYLSPQDVTSGPVPSGGPPGAYYPRSWPFWKQRAMGR